MQQLPHYASIINTEKPPLDHAGSFWGKKIGEWRIKMNLLIDKSNQSSNPFIRPYKRLIGPPTDVKDALWMSIRYGPDIYWINMNMPESEKYIDYYTDGSDIPSQSHTQKEAARQNEAQSVTSAPNAARLAVHRNKSIHYDWKSTVNSITSEAETEVISYQRSTCSAASPTVPAND
jgi:hypothetical protein